MFYVRSALLSYFIGALRCSSSTKPLHVWRINAIHTQMYGWFIAASRTKAIPGGATPKANCQLNYKFIAYILHLIFKYGINFERREREQRKKKFNQYQSILINPTWKKVAFGCVRCALYILLNISLNGIVCIILCWAVFASRSCIICDSTAHIWPIIKFH